MRGIIKVYKSDKGYGFIKTETVDCFFHVSNVKDTECEFLPGTKVEFDVVKTKKGFEAVNIVVQNSFVDKWNNKNSGFIKVGDTRIKLSNIKQYGISTESVFSDFGGFIETVFKPKRIHTQTLSGENTTREPSEGEIEDQIFETMRLEEPLYNPNLSIEQNIKELEKETTQNTFFGLFTKKVSNKGSYTYQYLQSIKDDPVYKKEKHGNLYYLYITTYQGDNYTWYDGEDGVDINKIRSELDTLL